MGKRTRECYLCGKKYSYCPTCSEDRTKPSWMIEFHEENCVKIFATCTEFNIGQLTKDEAKKALSNCDLSNKDAFAPYVQNDLSVIFAEDTITVDVEAEIKEIVSSLNNALESVKTKPLFSSPFFVYSRTSAVFLLQAL